MGLTLSTLLLYVLNLLRSQHFACPLLASDKSALHVFVLLKCVCIDRIHGDKKCHFTQRLKLIKHT
jgi:hypothetical protein